MNLDGFVATTLGQCLDLDGAWGCQCVDLADAWANFRGHPLPLVPDAASFVGWSGPGWAWVANTPEGVPESGALLVWDRRLGPAGHIALKTSVPADTNTFETEDQNWYGSNPDRGSAAALVTHNYTDVAGWLRPTQGGPHMPPTPFYISVAPGVSWHGMPAEGPIGSPLTEAMTLRVIEVSSDGNWVRPDIGSWWFQASDVQVVAPPAPPAPPVSADAARIARLERIIAGMQSALDTNPPG